MVSKSRRLRIFLFCTLMTSFISIIFHPFRREIVRFLNQVSPFKEKAVKVN